MTENKVTPIRPNIKALPDIKHFDFVVVPDKAEVFSIDGQEQQPATEMQTPKTSTDDTSPDTNDEQTKDHGARPMLW
ncbi:MAG: hypothetical protein ACRBCK_05720 [Alphaproteobacteria bacterium]